ncbi:hypothetical protein GCM10009716_06550 [Streptomyces sodiiphilus]|uniref:Uncharacterized protein n=1 Tax=Streptomyces sodiiphilus TaxID=226217 RepID=A0ABP5A725_9ACTN
MTRMASWRFSSARAAATSSRKSAPTKPDPAAEPREESTTGPAATAGIEDCASDSACPACRIASPT